MAEKKLTFGEWCGALFAGAFIGVFAIVFLGTPLMLLTAWMRELMWNWFFVAKFGAPHIGLWLWAAIGCMWGTFQVSNPALKTDLYENGAVKRLFYPFIANAVLFVMAWAIHTWILR